MEPAPKRQKTGRSSGWRQREAEAAKEMTLDGVAPRKESELARLVVYGVVWGTMSAALAGLKICQIPLCILFENLENHN